MNGMKAHSKMFKVLLIKLVSICRKRNGKLPTESKVYLKLNLPTKFLGTYLSDEQKQTMEVQTLFPKKRFS